jgi:hypothetical protein
MSQLLNMRVIASLLLLAAVCNAFQAPIVSRGKRPRPTLSHHAPAPFIWKAHLNEKRARDKMVERFSRVIKVRLHFFADLCRRDSVI